MLKNKLTNYLKISLLPLLIILVGCGEKPTAEECNDWRYIKYYRYVDNNLNKHYTGVHINIVCVVSETKLEKF